MQNAKDGLVEEIALVLYTCLAVQIAQETVNTAERSLLQHALLYLLIQSSLLLVCSKNLVRINGTIATYAALEGILGLVAGVTAKCGLGITGLGNEYRLTESYTTESIRYVDTAELSR